MVSIKPIFAMTLMATAMVMAVCGEAEKQRNTETLTNLMYKCQEENPSAVDGDTGEVKTNKEDVACYVKCLYEEVGMMNSNFTINPPIFAALFKNKRLNEFAQECLKKHPVQASRPEEICEITFKFYDCIRQNGPKILKRSIYLFYQTTVEEVQNRMPSLDTVEPTSETITTVDELSEEVNRTTVAN